MVTWVMDEPAGPSVLISGRRLRRSDLSHVIKTVGWCDQGFPGGGGCASAPREKTSVLTLGGHGLLNSSMTMKLAQPHGQECRHSMCLVKPG